MNEENIFSISEESEVGGSSHSWIEQKDKKYCLFGNELGQMTGPCETVLDALNASGFQFCMDYVNIECNVSAEQLNEILSSPAFIISNFTTLHINGKEISLNTVEE